MKPVNKEALTNSKLLRQIIIIVIVIIIIILMIKVLEYLELTIHITRICINLCDICKNFEHNLSSYENTIFC